MLRDFKSHVERDPVTIRVPGLVGDVAPRGDKYAEKNERDPDVVQHGVSDV
jgi:hypothetical protein